MKPLSSIFTEEAEALSFTAEAGGIPCLSTVRLQGSPQVQGGGTTVAVVGLGYVGLPTALSIASARSEVIGIDVSRSRLDAIRTGRVDLLPIDRVRLDAAVRKGQVTLTDSPESIRRADAVVICVPTPVDEHLVPDLACLESACAAVVRNVREGQTVILTSTSFVGTTGKLLVKPLVARGLTPGSDVFVAFSPERIDPGNVDHAQHTVPRVLGGVTPECTARAAAILRHMTDDVHVVSSVEAAELTKLYENTFRAVNIAFANEMAEMSSVLGLDVMEVIEAASTKPYGFMPFYPGPGVGGHCIPCDPHYLLWQMRAERHQPRLVEQAMSAIAARPAQVVERARDLLATEGRPVMGAAVLIVGVAYKPGVEDLRGSPALEVIETLRTAGADVAYHDPLIPSLRLADGSTLWSVANPEPAAFGLVIVHVIHPGFDRSWLARCRPLLDTTYRLRTLPDRAVL